MNTCHEVADEHCKHPANGIGSRCHTECFVCGNPVCTNAACSTKMPWYKYGNVRVCRGCRESAERMGEVKSEPMAKSRINFTIAMRDAMIAARNKLGISQAELAVNRCGLKTLGTISGLERGRIHSIKSDLLKKLETALGVKLKADGWTAENTQKVVDEQLPKRRSGRATSGAEVLEAIAGKLTIGDLAKAAGCSVSDIVARVMQ